MLQKLQLMSFGGWMVRVRTSYMQEVWNSNPGAGKSYKEMQIDLFGEAWYFVPLKTPTVRGEAGKGMTYCEEFADKGKEFYKYGRPYVLL